MIFQFAKLKDQKNQIKIIIVEDQLQELITDTCGIFGLYFYENLFNPLSDSKIINDEFQPKKKTIETLLNKIFFQQIKKNNEDKIKEFADEYNIKQLKLICR